MRTIPIQPPESLAQCWGPRGWTQTDLHATPHSSTPPCRDLEQVLLEPWFPHLSNGAPYLARCHKYERRNACKDLSVVAGSIRREVLLRLFQESRMVPGAVGRGRWRDVGKSVQTPAPRCLSSGDIMCSMVTITNKVVLHICKLRE